MHKKIISMILIFVMLFTLLPIQKNPIISYAKTAETRNEYVKTTIKKLIYTIEASNIKENTKLNVMGAGWKEKEEILDHTKSTQEITISFESEIDGIINMGYAYDEKVPREDNPEETDNKLTSNTASILIKKITVNDTYEILLEDVMLNSNSNGLKNIWSGLSDSEKAYEGKNCYIQFDQNAQLLYFYATSSEGGSNIPPEINKNTKSMQYVKAMGNGWNLGNSLESINTNLDEEDEGEESWGNPKVTKELIHSVKEKGFDSIRIPLTIYRRYTIKEDAAENECKYIINKEYLARAKEIIGWALEEGFYVMTNIHHDSWTWLESWDGQETSEEYLMFQDFWKQLAETFKDADNKLCFETMNEYDPQATGDITEQDKVMAMNKVAYDMIRSTGGNNSTRMIIMPSYNHNHETSNSSVLSEFIKSLDDENLIATVHYYSEWVYSSNIGKTGFDEPLWDDFTPRKSVDNFMKILKEQFLNDGIGVIVSEYGVLGYDTGDNCMQIGEEIKYYDYINAAAREDNVCLMFWDNGSAINRNTYQWKYKRVGDALAKTMDERIGYATDLDSIYFAEQVKEDVTIALTLNGTEFVGIKGLENGKEYTYENGVIILSKDYINNLLINASYGLLKDLEIIFNNDYIWHQYLIYYGTPAYQEAKGTRERIDIPFDFNGSEVRRITTYQAPGRVGPNSSWWNWLQYGKAFSVDYTGNKLSFLSELLQNETVQDGEMMAEIEFYDGQFMNVYMNIEGDIVTCTKKSVETNKLDCAKQVVLYAGEKEIPAQYITAPSGYKIYGIDVEDKTMVTLEGWPAIMTFDTKAHDTMTNLMLNICYMNVEQNCNVTLGIKDAPVVSPMAILVGKKDKVVIENLTRDAVCTYKLSDASIGTITEDGTITALKEGKTEINVIVEQYGRKDTFHAELAVTKDSTGTGSNTGNINQGNTSTGNTGSSTGINTGNGNTTVNNKKEDNNTEDTNETKEEEKNTAGNENNTENNKGDNTENNKKEEDNTEKKEPAKIGEIVKTKNNKGIFKVINTSNTVPEVSYTGIKNKTSIVIPNTITDENNIVYKVTSIAKNACKNNKKLKKVVISSNITEIGASAFEGCNKLTRITIPKKVKKIGKKAFYNCKSLKAITINTTRLTAKNVENNVFKGISKKAVIQVPKKKLNTYKKLFKSKGVNKEAVISK